MNQTQSNEAAQEATALRHVQLAADWYYFIVAVTIVVLMIVGYTGRSLPAFGLFTPVLLVGGIPQNMAASLFLLLLMAAILLVFIAIGIEAAEGSYDACRLGFALYLVDSVLMLLTFNPATSPFQRYGGLLFHFFGLVGLGNGIVAVSHLERLRHMRLMRDAAPRQQDPFPAAPILAPASTDPLPAPESATLPEAGRVGSVIGAPSTDPQAGENDGSIFSRLGEAGSVWDGDARLNPSASDGDGGGITASASETAGQENTPFPVASCGGSAAPAAGEGSEGAGGRIEET